LTLRGEHAIWEISGSEDMRPRRKPAGVCRQGTDFFIVEKLAGAFPNGKIRGRSRENKALADLDHG
jgi:hypothetical protein